MTPDNVVLRFHSFHSCDPQKAKYYLIFIFLCKKKKKTRLQKVFICFHCFFHTWTYFQVVQVVASQVFPFLWNQGWNQSSAGSWLWPGPVLTRCFSSSSFFSSNCQTCPPNAIYSTPPLVSPMTRCPKRRQTWWVTVSSTLVATLCWLESLLLRTLSRTRSPASSYSCASPLYSLTNTHPDTHTNAQSFNQRSRRAHTVQNI